MGAAMGEKLGWGPGLFLLCILSLLHTWDFLSFPALGIAEENLQLFLVNAIVILGLFSKYSLRRKKGASGSFECQEG